MAKFFWRHGFESKINADAVGEELARIRESKGGRLTPADVVEAARRRASPLRDCFTWDNTEAAEKWRLTEARRLIQGILIEHPRPEREPLIAYISVTDERQGRCYKESRIVMEDMDFRAQALRECRDAIAAWRRRFRKLEDVIQALDDFEELLPPD